MKTKITNKVSTRVFALLALILCGATIGTAAPGDLDPTFGNGGKVITDGNFPGHLQRVKDIAIQPDGKIIAVGDGSIGFGRDFAVVRYNQNGSLDTSFGGSGIVITRIDNNASADAYSVAIQADGKIVVAGGMRWFNKSGEKTVFGRISKICGKNTTMNLSVTLSGKFLTVNQSDRSPKN